MIPISRWLGALATIAILSACSGGASDNQSATTNRIEYKATLDGQQEAPPVMTAGSGSGTIFLDRATGRLFWDISIDGLSSPVTAAHLHGPAGPGVAADVQVPLEVAASSPQRISGQAQLTDEQMRQVLSGLWYVNIHTEQHPDGEIRGQVENAGM